MRSNLDCAGATDRGRSRETNQDHFLIANLKKSMMVDSTSLPLTHRSRLYGGSMGRLMMVADGMGGHASGERASTLAIDYMIEQLLNSLHWCFNLDRDPENDFIEDLKQLLQSAHQRIVNEGMVHSEQRGMGTTFTMAYVIWPRMYLVHAGDSRCYLFRRGVCERLTTDHTLARQLVDSGGMTAEEASTSRWSNVLWNVLGGGNGELTAEVRRVDLVAGDSVLLCTDGLYRYLNDQELMAHLQSPGSAESICRDLICAANERGGADNITAAVALFGQNNSDDGETTIASEVPFRQVLAGPEAKKKAAEDYVDLDTQPG
jgi:protein phosphatase